MISQIKTPGALDWQAQSQDGRLALQVPASPVSILSL